jgi:hypothetical protein
MGEENKKERGRTQKEREREKRRYMTTKERKPWCAR